MTSLAADVDYNRLNNLLWRYRNCFDRFEFLLEVQLMVTASGRQEWQHHMADLLDDLAQRIGRLDLEREVLLGGELNLSALVAGAPAMWAEILTEQQDHLTEAAARVGRLRQRNEQALEAGAAGLRRLLEALAQAAAGTGDGMGPGAGNTTGSGSGSGSGSTGTDGYGGDGRVRPPGGSPLLFDGRV